MSSSGKDKKKGGIIGKSFQKMRRRLTVVGGGEGIDGISASGSTGNLEKIGQETGINCAVTEYYGVSKKGHAPYNPRKKNQDAIIMLEEPKTNSLVLCTLDGHGEQGDHVAQWFREKLPKNMFGHPLWATNLQVAVTEAIAKVEKELLKFYKIDTEFSGTTLSMAIIRDNHLTGVNIGDSRVILARDAATPTPAENAVDNEATGLAAVEITLDHKPDTPEEKARIIAAGGRVFAVQYDDGIDGPPRVWLGHTDIPGLAMARSLGDVVAHSAGVISDPDFTEFDLDPKKDKFLVVATDGLWEFITNEETVKMVESNRTPAEAVDVLVTEAGTRWMQEEQVIDDTSIIVANLFGYKAS